MHGTVLLYIMDIPCALCLLLTLHYLSHWTGSVISTIELRKAQSTQGTWVGFGKLFRNNLRIIGVL